MTWESPSFVEIDMSAEIGAYQEDFDPQQERDYRTPKPLAKRRNQPEKTEK